MQKAEELLKKALNEKSDATTSVVQINWKLPDSKTRRILVNNLMAFTQTEHDACGTFSSLYHGLSID